jgi:hypothetical protein
LPRFRNICFCASCIERLHAGVAALSTERLHRALYTDCAQQTDNIIQEETTMVEALKALGRSIPKQSTANFPPACGKGASRGEAGFRYPVPGGHYRSSKPAALRTDKFTVDTPDIRTKLMGQVTSDIGRKSTHQRPRIRNFSTGTSRVHGLRRRGPQYSQRFRVINEDGLPESVYPPAPDPPHRSPA